MSEKTELVAREALSTEAVQHLPIAAPDVDIFENENEILLRADLPGVRKEDININIDNGKLSLSGVRRLPTSGTMAWREFSDLEFRRTFAVPQNIDLEKIHAAFQEGVLSLHLPKPEAARPRQIEIKAA